MCCATYGTPCTGNSHSRSTYKFLGHYRMVIFFAQYFSANSRAVFLSARIRWCLSTRGAISHNVSSIPEFRLRNRLGILTSSQSSKRCCMTSLAPMGSVHRVQTTIESPPDRIAKDLNATPALICSKVRARSLSRC